MIIIAVVAVMIIGAILLFYLFPLIKVEGDSMLPTYTEGEILIGSRLFDKENCKCGNVYIIHLRDEESGEPYYIVKRLDRKGYDVRTQQTVYFFLGDNLRVSADSRIFGYFTPDKVVAKVLGKRGKLNERESE